MIILAAAIILTLNNSGIIQKANEAVEVTDLSQVKHIASLKWSEAYLNKVEDIEDYVLTELSNQRINTDKYDITVTKTVVDVELKEEIPSEWIENVVEVKDGVPIPKGFVASRATGENRKVNGLVIYEGDELVTNDNVEEAKRERNQYVWVPVDKETFVTTFVRKDFHGRSSSGNILDENGKYYREGEKYNFWEVTVDDITNLPKITENSMLYMSEATTLEVQAMYASVKEYGGFYVARYEAGIDSLRTSADDALITGTNVYSKMGKIPYTNIKWSTSKEMNVDAGAVVEVARGLYPVDNSNNITGVVSTLMYAVQWDTTLQWLLDTKAVTSVANSMSYGNHIDHIINSSHELNDGARVSFNENYVWTSYLPKDNNTIKYPKESGKGWKLTTGALKMAKVNNIYDMAGNVAEWTMEGNDRDMRVSRGGAFNSEGKMISSSISAHASSSPTYSTVDHGFRPCLYIKQ